MCAVSITGVHFPVSVRSNAPGESDASCHCPSVPALWGRDLVLLEDQLERKHGEKERDYVMRKRA